MFLPLSKSCGKVDLDPEKLEPGFKLEDIEDIQAIEIPFMDVMFEVGNMVPFAVPADLLPHIQRVHENPVLWWMSQIVGFLLRVKPSEQQKLDSEAEQIGFATPSIGVHIRRSDKVDHEEASEHHVDEYMEHVIDLSDFMLMTSLEDKRYVYLATDEPQLHEQAIERYPQFEFIFSTNSSITATVLKRHSFDALRGVMLDLQLLSRCEYIVCTLSSGLCRLAYELQQSRQDRDVSRHVKSLDDVYYFGGTNSNRATALSPHTPSNSSELAFKIGDRIFIIGDLWNGWSVGENQRTGEKGTFPSYKVDIIYEAAHYPIYDPFSSTLD